MMYRKEGRWPDFDKVHGIFYSRARERSQMLPITFDHWLYAEGHYRLLSDWSGTINKMSSAWESVKKSLVSTIEKSKFPVDNTWGISDPDEMAVLASYIWEPSEGVLDIKETAKMFVPAYPAHVDKWGYIIKSGEAVLDTVRKLWGIPDDLAPQIRKKPYGS